MDRTLAPIGIILLVTIALGVGCTREEGKPAATATATPVVKAVAPSPQTAASPGGDVEELYVDLEADPDEGAPPLTVQFTSSLEEATPPFTYKWDFGDGSPPAGDANPKHVYQKPGEYTATVTVKDSKGQIGSEEIDILVEAE